jgi:putative SOS response-associated peptidase YedK
MLDAREAPWLRERFRPSFNIAPTTDVVGLATSPHGNRVLDLYRWGLVPSWARDASVGSRLFNARADGVAGKPAFVDAFRWRPSLDVIASGRRLRLHPTRRV